MNRDLAELLIAAETRGARSGKEILKDDEFVDANGEKCIKATEGMYSVSARYTNSEVVPHSSEETVEVVKTAVQERSPERSEAIKVPSISRQRSAEELKITPLHHPLSPPSPPRSAFLHDERWSSISMSLPTYRCLSGTSFREDF